MEAEKNCETVTDEEVLNQFALSFLSEVIGDYVGDLVAEYGTKALAKGLKKLGFDEWAEKLLRKGDDVVDDLIPQGGICFEAGTLVAKDSGSVPIEAIRTGDLVWAFDTETGVTGLFTVTSIFSHPTNALVEVVVDDEMVRATPEHPFWVDDKGWVGAEDLAPGDCVRTLSGGCQRVINVQVVFTDVQVYNFTVITVHTYFVGDGQWLVHNQCQAQGVLRFGDNDLVLGLNRRGRLRQVVQQFGGKKYADFDIPGGSFERQIKAAMDQAEKIRFDLTDVELERIQGKSSYELLGHIRGEPMSGNYTNYELLLIKTCGRKSSGTLTVS
jgi:hypothetical protein